MKKGILTLISLGLVSLLFNPASATGTIIVSGDSTIIRGADPADVLFDEGNFDFFINVLGTGTSVTILDGGNQLSGNQAPFLNTFYSSITGVATNLLAGEITAADLQSTDLFISALPTDTFTNTEATALADFLGGGGTAFFLGEADCCDDGANSRINNLLNTLGSTISINGDGFGPPFGQATIGADPLTNGVSSFTYANSSEVVGGTSIFIGLDNRAVVATEAFAPVPLPSALLLLAFPLAGLRIFKRSS